MFKASSVSHVGDTIKYPTAQYVQSVLTITSAATTTTILNSIVTATALYALHIPRRIRCRKCSKVFMIPLLCSCCWQRLLPELRRSLLLPTRRSQRPLRLRSPINLRSITLTTRMTVLSTRLILTNALSLGVKLSRGRAWTLAYGLYQNILFHCLDL